MPGCGYPELPLRVASRPEPGARKSPLSRRQTGRPIADASNFRDGWVVAVRFLVCRRPSSVSSEIQDCCAIVSILWHAALTQQPPDPLNELSVIERLGQIVLRAEANGLADVVGLVPGRQNQSRRGAEQL